MTDALTKSWKTNLLNTCQFNDSLVRLGSRKSLVATCTALPWILRAAFGPGAAGKVLNKQV